MKRWLILFSVGCLVFASAANAAVEQGDTQIELLGGYLTENLTDDAGGGDISALFIMGGLGYFLTDNIQVGAVGMYANLDDGSDDVDVYGVGAAGKVHFMTTNQLVPYAGAQILWANYDDGTTDGDGVLWGPVAGLRYELNAYNDFFVEGQYHIWAGDIDMALDDGFGIFLGLLHQFK